VIEKRKSSSRQWERASGCVASDVTQFKVSRLDEGQTYFFQVLAENDQGCGPPLTTQFETLAKDPFGKLHLIFSLFPLLCVRSYTKTRDLKVFISPHNGSSMYNNNTTKKAKLITQNKPFTIYTLKGSMMTLFSWFDWQLIH